MKKNYLLGMYVAAGMLLATSCSNDELEVAQSENEAQVTFSLGLENAIGSRALISDGTKADKLVYAVYKLDEQNNDTPVLQNVVGSTNGQFIKDDFQSGDNVKITLAKGQTYQVAFWAQDGDCTAYDTDDLTKVEVDYTNAANNDELRDAFFKTVEFTVAGNKTIDVVLKRPFAQINVGVYKTDWEAAVASGIEIEKSTVIIENAATSINLLTGAVGPETTDVKVTYSSAAIPTEELKVDQNKDGDFEDENERYAWLSMSYILAADHDETKDENGMLGTDKATLTGLTYTFTPKSGNAIEFSKGLNGAPVRRNWRTNILGKILTGDIEFKVTIDPVYDGDYNYPEASELAQQLEMAATFGGTVTLTNDVNLEAPLNVTADMVINLNGKTISGNWHKNEGAVITNNGNLKLVGGTVSSTGNNGGSALQNNGIAIVEGTTLNGAPNADGSWPSYTVNNTGTLTLNESTITSYHGAVASYGNDAVVTLNNSVIDMAGIPGFTSHGIYTYNNGKVIVNGGTYKNKATDQNASGASVINGNVEVNAGDFTGRIENYYGTPVLKGGIYSVKPTAYIATGYKALEKNGKYVVVANDIDAACTSQEELNKLVPEDFDGKVIALTAGEYVLPDAAAGKTFTIKGTDNPADVILVAENDGAAEGNCDYSLKGSKVTFNNVTITTTGTYFPGYAYMEGTFNNCIINGVYTVYESSSFNDCTFNIEGDLYNLWTWGGEEVNLNNCTFNCDGKAVLLYGAANTKLVVNNCTFNDNGDDTVTGKAAIEIGNDYNKSYELTVNNTVVNGFAINPNGFNTGTTLWANKNSMTPENLKVTVDGKNAYIIVASDEASIKSAIDAGTTVVGLKAGTYTFPASSLKEGVTLVCEEGTVFEGNSKLNIKGATVIGATFSNPTGSAVDQTINGTFKDCTFTGANGLRSGIAGETVVFENCVFDGSTYGVHFDDGANDVIFRNCTLSGFNALGAALTMVTFEGCTFVGNGKSGYNGANLWGSAKMINCEFTFDSSTATEWIDCIGADKTYEFTNCTVNGEAYTKDNYSTYDKIFSRNHVTVKINGVDCQL